MHVHIFMHVHSITPLHDTPYSENLLREKTFVHLSKNGISRKLFLYGLLTRTAYCRPSLHIITEKTFADRHKTATFAKVFLLYG